MSSLIEGVGAISPQLLAGYGQGLAKSEDYKFRSRQADAKRAIEREAQALRKHIADVEAEHHRKMEEIAKFKADLDKAEADAKAPLTKAMTSYYGARTATDDQTRPGKVAELEKRGRLTGLRGDDLAKALELGVPELTADNLRAQLQGRRGTERRAEQMQPHKIKLTDAQSRYLGAQATSVPIDDARMKKDSDSLAQYRRDTTEVARRTATSNEERVKIEGQRERDWMQIQTIGANLEKIRTTNDTTRANAYASDIASKIKVLEGFPKEWIQSLDRDIKIGYARNKYGKVSNDEAPVAARARADYLLKAMEQSILQHDFEPFRVPGQAPGGPPVLPDAEGEAGVPSWMQGALGVFDPVRSALSAASPVAIREQVQGALGPNPGAGIGVALERGRQVLGKQLRPVGEALGMVDPPARTAPTKAVKQMVRWSLKDPTRWQMNIAFLRSRAGDRMTPEIRQHLAAFREITGREWKLPNHPNRPPGVSNGDVDVVRALLADGSFETYIQGARLSHDEAAEKHLLAAYRYLHPGKPIPSRGGRPRPASGVSRPGPSRPGPSRPRPANPALPKKGG